MAYSQLSEEAGSGVMAYDLSKFNRGNSWDLQRLNGGQFDSRFVDGATVAIGVYAESANIDINHLLAIQDVVAMSSHNPPDTQYDPVFTHLPIRNVRNTEIGYALVKRGLFGGVK